MTGVGGKPSSNKTLTIITAAAPLLCLKVATHLPLVSVGLFSLIFCLFFGLLSCIFFWFLFFFCKVFALTSRFSASSLSTFFFATGTKLPLKRGEG